MKKIRLEVFAILLALGLLVGCGVGGGDAPPTGTFERPFAADSLINSEPIEPTLGTYAIPDTPTGYRSTIIQEDYGVSIYEAKPEHGPMTIMPQDEAQGINNPNGFNFLPSVTVPHFPVDVLPPSGTDGSVAIVDVESGVIYNFWQLTKDDAGTWRTTQVATGDLQGTGFGDPAHFVRGAPASGAENIAGLIRKSEHEDKDAPMYPHALHSTLDASALLNGKSLGGDQWTVAYIWPATSGDGYGPSNTGQIPEGARLMLPSDYPVDQLKSAELRKLARTLQTYGTYVLDRNEGTPITFSASTDFTYELGDTPYHQEGRTPQQDYDAFIATGVPDQLEDIRRSLRMMTGNEGYRTADREVIQPKPGFDVNLLSLRGDWQKQGGEGPVGVFNALNQRLEFTGGNVIQTQTLNTDWQMVEWAELKPNEPVRLTVTAEGGASLGMNVKCNSGGQGAGADTNALSAQNPSFDFVWPQCDDFVIVSLTAQSGEGPSWVQADLRRR